jgi:glycosyltransferase involved in cell wall biosynthesis
VKVLQVVPSYLPAMRYGGPIYAVHGLAVALRRRGHRVHVFTTDRDGDRRLDVEPERPQLVDGVVVRYFPVAAPRRLCRAPSMSAALRAELAECDVVHLHSLFLWPTLAAARAAMHGGVPFLVSPRGMLVRDLLRRRGRFRKTLWLWLFERRTLESADGIHVTSELEAREARAFGLRLPRIHIVPNGIDPDRGREPGGALPESVAAVAERRPFVLFLGRLSWKKGIEHAVDALPALPDLALVVAGPDDEALTPSLRARAAQKAVAERVHFVGPVEGAAKAALLRDAVALVLPSLSENFGNVVLEAAAAGCPALVSPGVGLGPELEASGAGMIVPQQGLAALVASPRRRNEMGQSGPGFAARFGWAGVAARMEAVYESLRP